MKILPSNQYYSSRESHPAFGAKVNKKVVTGVTDGLFQELSGAVQADGLAQKIREQITNPKQKNIFFATVASLITATAAQLTGILTGEAPAENTSDSDIIETKKTPKKVENSDGDVYEAAVKNEDSKETKTELRLSKHKGILTKVETDLIATVNQISKSMKLQENVNAKLAEIYNKFCGANYKGAHYSAENELRQNKDIAQDLNKELTQCGTIEDLNNVIFRYNKYSLEPDNTNSETIKVIQDYNKFTNAYISLTRDKKNETKQHLVEEFVKDINALPLPKSIKQMRLKSINDEYSDNLPQLVSVYYEIKNNSADLAEKFLTLINSKRISNTALQDWNGFAYKTYLDFFEYNSMVKNGIDEASIKEIAMQKRNTKMEDSITVTDKENFALTPPAKFIDKNFRFINTIFKLVHSKENYASLNVKEPETYTIADIESEILKRSDSYPNLIKHLTVTDKTYLNQGKMQNLLNLYYGNKVNTNMFTIHSYLRFIERVVFPTINEYQGLEDTNCNIINTTYINKMKDFRCILRDAFKQPLEIQTYMHNDVKAPQFEIPMANSEGNNFVITINAANKIHTIF